MGYRLRRVLVSLALFALLFIPAQSVSGEVDPALQTGRWIDVDLVAHTATAYDGATPVRVIAVTAGKPGYETPVGTFRIFARVEEETMSSETMGVPRDAPEGYYVEHVRYVQYFADGGVAFHANYWTEEGAFGNTNTSHGCVSMRQADAAFLWSFTTYGSPVVVHKESTVKVPNVEGLTVADARASLDKVGLTAEEKTQVTSDKAPGTVVDQQPPALTAVERGGTVTLVVAEAPKEPTPRVVAPVRTPVGNDAWVPELVGIPEAEARARIEQAGLSQTYTNYQKEGDVAEGSQEFFRSIPKGAVLSQSVPAGQKVMRGTVVAIAVRQP